MKKIFCEMSNRASFVIVLALSAASTTSWADESHTLATSKARKLSVYAVGSETAWCGSALRLKMVLEDDSPDLANPPAQVELMNRLKTPITTDCQTAKSAELLVIEHGKQVGSYKAAAEGGWVFAATAPVVTSAAVSSAPSPASAPAAVPKVSESPTLATPPAPAQASSGVSPPPAQSPSAPASPMPPSGQDALPREVGYASALLRFVHDKPALLQDDGILRTWANYRYSREYAQVANQEFKLQPLLAKAKEDLEQTIAQVDTQYVVIPVHMQFGNYDFGKQRFPLNFSNESLTVGPPCCVTGQNVPQLEVKVEDLDAIAGIPMTNEAAQAFVQRRTRYGYVDRAVLVLVTVKLDDVGFQEQGGGWGWSRPVALGRLHSVVFLTGSDPQKADVIARLSPDVLQILHDERVATKAAAAKAEAERQAMLRQQQLRAQRDTLIQNLSNRPLSVRLANFMSTEGVNGALHLSSLRDARGRALVSGKPVPVVMLIQADASGRDQVRTAWPGHMRVTVPQGQAELKSSGWFLVRGVLSAEMDGDKDDVLSAEIVYACAQEKCADAAEPTAIVDRKLASVAVTQ